MHHVLISFAILLGRKKNSLGSVHGFLEVVLTMESHLLLELQLELPIGWKYCLLTLAEAALELLASA